MPVGIDRMLNHLTPYLCLSPSYRVYLNHCHTISPHHLSIIFLVFLFCLTRPLLQTPRVSATCPLAFYIYVQTVAYRRQLICSTNNTDSESGVGAQTRLPDINAAVVKVRDHRLALLGHLIRTASGFKAKYKCLPTNV